MSEIPLKSQSSVLQINEKNIQYSNIFKVELPTDYFGYKSYFGMSHINARFWAVFPANGFPEWTEYKMKLKKILFTKYIYLYYPSTPKSIPSKKDNIEVFIQKPFSQWIQLLVKDA